MNPALDAAARDTAGLLALGAIAAIVAWATLARSGATRTPKPLATWHK
jgi:hypothetical protein